MKLSIDQVISQASAVGFTILRRMDDGVGMQLSRLRVIVSNGGGWDHASVSTATRMPTWLEMEFVRKVVFGEESLVMQLHPPRSLYCNAHPFCLHLWRPQNASIPRPPSMMVAPTFADGRSTAEDRGADDGQDHGVSPDLMGSGC